MKKSKAPMTLGILSLISWIIPALGLLLSISGIVVSSKQIKRDSCKAYKIGLKLSIAGIILSVIYFGIAYYIQMKLIA